MAYLKSCIVVVVVAICFYGTSALFFSRSKSGSASGAAAGEASGGNYGQLNMSIKFQNKYVAKFAAALEASYKAFITLITTLEENAGVTSSSAFRLFVEPMNDFFALFQNVIFTSVKQYFTTVIKGLSNLRGAIDNGWKLVSDLNSQGFRAYGAVLAGFVAGLETLFTLAHSMEFLFHFSAGGSGQGAVVGGGAATTTESVTIVE